MGTHIPKVMVKHQGKSYSPISKSMRKDVLLELMEVSNNLQETITASTIRKRNVNELMKMMTKEKDVEDEEKLIVKRKRNKILLVMEKLTTQNPQVKKNNQALKIDVIKLKMF